MQGSRPERVGDQIRAELSELLARQVQRSRHRLRDHHPRQGQRRSAGRARPTSPSLGDEQASATPPRRSSGPSRSCAGSSPHGCGCAARRSSPSSTTSRSPGRSASRPARRDPDGADRGGRSGGRDEPGPARGREGRHRPTSSAMSETTTLHQIRDELRAPLDAS